MALSCGIVGLPNVGKTTIFGAMVGKDVERSDFMFSTTGPVKGMVDLPDHRLEKIAQFIPPEKIIPAQMAVTDIPGLISGSSHGEGMGISFLGAIKDSDVLLHVIRCFNKEGLEHVTGSLDPAIDAEIVDLELGQADLGTLERNVERVGKKARTGDKDSLAQKEAFEKAKGKLDAGIPLRQVDWTKQELDHLRPLFLMTLKPMLFVANVGDDDLNGESDHVLALRDYGHKTGCKVAHICGDLEAELGRLDEEECAMFMEELGMAESGLSRFIHQAFDLLGLQTYFTAGEMEVRAWVIRKGDTAPVSAGVIHTDFERKFIRVEVYTFDDLTEHESEVEIKAAGKMRTEGKDYVVKDGDVCHFLIGN